MDEDKKIEKMNFKLQVVSHFPKQIIKLWIVSQRNYQYRLAQCLLNGNDKIRQIINLNLIYYLEKYKKNNGFYNLWKIVDEIDENTFEYILDNDLYDGINLCNSVIKSSEYVKKLLDKGYDYIFYYIDESVFFELLEDDKYKNRLLNFLKEIEEKLNIHREITFLQSDKVFIYIVNYLCKNTNDLYEKRKILEKLLTNINSEYRTKEKVLAVSLNIGAYLYNRDENNFFNNLLKKNFGDNYYESDRSETIRRIIDLGFIPSNSTVVAHENEYNVFIENNFFQVLNYDCIINSLIYPTEDTLILAHKKGCNLSNLYYIKNILEEYSIDNNEVSDAVISFCEFVRLNSNFKRYIFSKEQITKSNVDALRQYCAFVKVSGNILEDYVKNIDDINKYFDEYGPRESLYLLADSSNPDLINALYKNENYMRVYLTRIIKGEKLELYNKLCEEFGEENVIQFSITNVNPDIKNFDMFFSNIFSTLYEKKDVVHNYLINNDELLLTLNNGMLDYVFHNVRDDLLQILFLYPNLQKKILELSKKCSIERLIKIINYIADDTYNLNMDIMPILYDVINNYHYYYYIIDNLKSDIFSEKEIINNLVYILYFSSSIFEIESEEDLLNSTFLAKKNNYLNKIKNNINNIDILTLKNAILQKKYGLNLEKVSFITKRYCSNIEELKNSELDRKYINILLDFNDIVNCNSLEKLKFMYLTSPQIITDYKTITLLESSIRGEYAKLYSESIYRLNDNHKLTNNLNTIENREIFNKLSRETYDQKHPEFYVINGDFNLQVHVLGAYREYDRPSNFKENWNRPKIANHGICTSYISNNQIAAARQYHPMIGFCEYSGEDMLLCAPYDLSSDNTDFNSSMEMEGSFLTPKYMINNTRDSHNEIVIERKKFENGKIIKKQPSYILLIVDDINNEYNYKRPNELTNNEKKSEYKVIRANLYEETLQASIDFNLPIVVVDRLKYAKLERQKCDNLLSEFKKNHNLDLLEQLFLCICNNLIGCIDYYNIELEYCKLFNMNVLENYFNIIINIINSFSMHEKILAYNRLLIIKSVEIKKFNRDVYGDSYFLRYLDFYKKMFDENNLKKLLNMDHIIKNQSCSPIVDSTFDEEKYKELVNLVLSLDDNIKDEVYNDYQNGVIIEEIIKKINNNIYGSKRR